MIALVASYCGADTMAATRLDCTPGDPDYLKTVLLRLYAHLGDGPITNNEGSLVKYYFITYKPQIAIR